MIGLCTCVSHVPAVCDDGGYVGSDFGSAGELEGHSWYKCPQPRRSILPPCRASSVDRGGWLQLRVPGDADTAHDAQVFRHVQSCSNDE